MLTLKIDDEDLAMIIITARRAYRTAPNPPFITPTPGFLNILLPSLLLSAGFSMNFVQPRFSARTSTPAQYDYARPEYFCLNLDNQTICRELTCW